MSKLWIEIFNEKYKAFRAGFIGGLFTWGGILFGNTHWLGGYGHLIVVYFVKLFATFIGALATGLGGVAAKPAWKLLGKLKRRIFKKKSRHPNYGETFSQNGHSTNNKKAS